MRGATLSKPSPGLHLSCFPFPSPPPPLPHLSQRPPTSTPAPSHLVAVAFSSPPTSPQSPGGAGGRWLGARLRLALSQDAALCLASIEDRLRDTLIRNWAATLKTEEASQVRMETPPFPFSPKKRRDTRT